jgi:Na(+)/H(+) antiporter
MAWDHLAINKPHLVYIILGGFTSLFMLCSLFVKEKLYIGEATVATICGIIFGPHAANLIDPSTWGNVDSITLEFSRIVLVVQCFAVGVELPKAYMERHWKSVVFLLLPVMTFGWLITSLFIWWMIVPLSWLESLAVAACVTATDPVLASSVVGKGKFAKRVPKHLRDVLSAESGCNDGMAFPFIYLSVYLLRYDLEPSPTVFHWTCYTILYECIFGAFYGFMVGYIARHAIKWADRKGVIDRESFLVFYFVLALFCAGSGSMLGMDDLLIGFSAGVGFSNDGWFTEKTEESHVSNVIDLLINLAYFVYFGTIIPWDQYNSPDHGITPWRLVVIAIFVIFFRRIPIMMALKPIIPDVKTWREALFAGHFGPIGVGAIFAAILARAELETDSTEPLAVLPGPRTKDYELIYLVWPIVTFLVIASILVHGSSIAVFTLGKRINTLTITLSYTQDNENGPGWMNRLPRIQSQSKSQSKYDNSSMESLEKMPEFPPGTLPPTGMPGNFLRRQKDEDYNKPNSRPSSLRPTSRRKKRKAEREELRRGGPVDPSAIGPQRRSEPTLSHHDTGSDTLNEKSSQSPTRSDLSPGKEKLATGSLTSSPERDMIEVESEAKEQKRREHRSLSPRRPADLEVYEEGHQMIIEDTEGTVLTQVDTGGMSPGEKATIISKERNKLTKETSGEHAKHKYEAHPGATEGEKWEAEAEESAGGKRFRKQFSNWKGWAGKEKATDLEGQNADKKRPERKRGPAHAYQFGNTVIVEDEDGEVIKKYTLPSADRPAGQDRKGTIGATEMRKGLNRMGTWVGLGRHGDGPDTSVPADGNAAGELIEGGSDERVGKTTQAAEKKIDRTNRGDDDNDVDDGLRMTISRTDRYGLTGLRRRADAAGVHTVEMPSGRRMSTKDFIKQMQQLDPKSKIEKIDESDAPEEMKREVRREAHAEKAARGTSGRPRSRTNPSQTPRGQEVIGKGDEGDYFSPSRSRKPETRRATTDTRRRPSPPPRQQSEDDDDDDSEDEEDGVQAARGTRPEPASRTTTSDTTHTEDYFEDEDIPTHDITSTLARYGKGSTAADSRRARLSTINSGEATPSQQQQQDEQGETAAEKRRRLAALGVSNQDSSSSSEEEDVDAPRRPREEPIPEPRRRVQWGGESGREAEERQRREDKEEQEKETASRRPGQPSGGMARRKRAKIFSFK